MHDFITPKRLTLAAAIMLAATAMAEDVVTLRSPGPGQLRLTPEAYVATKLKITGRIDARDFQTLKPATMSVTQELDLSEAVIEQSTQGGCYSPITSDWIIGDTPKHDYPANTMPVHAFTMVGDNSFKKWHYGSSSLTKIILPETIRAIDDDAFYKMGYLTEMELSRFSTTARCIDNVLYNYETTRMTGIVPVYKDRLVLPHTLTAVTDSVFNGAAIRGIEIQGRTKVDFGRQGKFACPYVIADNPADYADVFPNADITTGIEPVTVSDVTAGTLAERVGLAGWAQGDVRHLIASGIVGKADVEWLTGLPNLHFLDLSAAVFSGEALNIRDNDALCEIRLPSGQYALTMTDCDFIGGTLDVPEGVSAVTCTGLPMLTGVRLPSTLTTLGSNSFNSSLIEKADLSACIGLTDINGFFGCYRLRTLLLPPYLETLYGTDGPVENVELPATLKKLSASGWNVAQITLPSTLEYLDLRSMLKLKKIEAFRASSLKEVYAISYCPLLETLDFTATPLTKFSDMAFDLLPEDAATAQSRVSARVVVTGSTKNSVIHSSLRSLRLPATVESISNISGCRLMEELDLNGCAGLKTFSELRDMPALKTLRLPGAMERFGSICNCPALDAIYCATYEAVPTTGTPDEEWAKTVNLYVPIGCRGKYLTATGWGDYGNIEEYGYSVIVRSALSGAQPAGGGMYPAGTAVTVSANATITDNIDNYELTAWRIGGNIHHTVAATYTFTPQANAVAEPEYALGAPSLEKADISMTLTANKATTVDLVLGGNSNSDKRVYYIGNTRYETTGSSISLPLQAGDNRVCLSGADLRNLDFENIETDNISMSNLSVKTPENISSIFVDYIACNTLNLKGFTGLKYLYCSNTGLTALDVSDCTNLNTLRCYSNNITTLDVSNCKNLQGLYCAANRMRSLKLPEEPVFTSFNFGYNSFAFSQFTPALAKLAAKLNSTGDSYSCEYNPPASLYKGDILDLSSELTAADGSPVEITLTYNSQPVEGTDGRYSMSETGYYRIDFTCAAMPELTFYGGWWVSINTGIAVLPLDGIRLTQAGGTVSVSGLPDDADIIVCNTGGATVARAQGATATLDGLEKGVYIIKISDTQGRTASLKIAVK